MVLPAFREASGKIWKTLRVTLPCSGSAEGIGDI
jgi:hypothetical protein